MDASIVLPVAIPLGMAAVIAAVRPVVGRAPLEIGAIAAAASSAVLAAVCMIRAANGVIVYWFGGWFPRQGEALGVAFAVDPFSAGAATVCAILVLLALIFGAGYFDDAEHVYFVIMLVLLGGMIGFVFSGDLFNLFVWFELFSVASYVLTGYKTEERAPIQGAWNFAITNGAAAYLLLNGVALLYARTGTLNLALMGERLAARPPDALTSTAFALLCAGLLTKAAVVPFHFWIADAHSAAPAPVCAIFSGIMVPLGLFGVARVYWTVFEPHAAWAGGAPSHLLVGLGTITALAGGVMVLRQRQIKRLTAYSTAAHMGIMAIGIGLFEPEALAAVALYAIAHAAKKVVLFLGHGVILHREGSLDVDALHGRGRQVPVVAGSMLVAALASAEMPLALSSLGAESLARATRQEGWKAALAAILYGTSVLVGAGLIGMVARIWLGLGMRQQPKDADQGEQGTREDRETHRTGRTTPWTMVAPILVCAVALLALRWVPPLERWIHEAARLFADRHAYADAVLRGQRHALAMVEPAPRHAWESVPAIASTILAIVLAALLLRRQLFNRVPRPVRLLERFHSGHPSDDIAWLTVGASILAALFLAFIP